MKLLLCKNCMSIFNLTRKPKTCECGESKGHYTDNLNAVHSGPSVPIGFANNSFVRALKIQELLNEEEKWNGEVCCEGEEFTAFIIPAWASSVKTLTETEPEPPSSSTWTQEEMDAMDCYFNYEKDNRKGDGDLPF